MASHWLPRFSPAPLGFNRGRTQVNPNGLQNGQYEFLDLVKTGLGWAEADTNKPVDPTTLDSNGWPISFSPGANGVKMAFQLPTQASRPGRYAITWDSVSGAGGGIQLSAPARLSPTGSQDAGGGPGGTNRYEFLPGDGDQINFGIKTLGGTNYRVFHVDDEASLLAGNMFGTKFKERLIEANFGAIRFLNWTGFGLTTWASRRPVTYAYYGGHEQRGSMYAGVTAGTGNAYTVSRVGFTLADKASLIVRFNRNQGDGPATLNVQGTGDIQVLNPSSYQPFDPIAADTYAQVVYDATLNAWLRFGGSLNDSRYLDNGVPPEVQIRLCVECRAYFEPVLPYLTSDPMTDYIPMLAMYCRDNTPSWFKVHFGGVNEVFNFAAIPTQYAINKAIAYGWDDSMHNWMGKSMSTLGQAVSAVYGGDRRRYDVLCGLQGATGVNQIQCENSNNRLQAAAYVADTTHAVQAPLTGPWGTITFTKSPAYNWVTAISPANYITPSEYYFPSGVIRAFDFAVTAAGNPTAQAARVSEFLETYHGDPLEFNLPYLKMVMENWKLWAAGFGITKIMPYEGGYSPDYSSIRNGPAVAGVTAAASAVLTVPSSCSNGQQKSGNCCAARATPMRLVISGWNGTMGAAHNGHTYDITAVSADQVTINANTTGLAFAPCTIANAVDSGSGVNRAVVHQVGHGYGSNEQGFFTTTGSLPGFSTGVLYYIHVIDADNFALSLNYSFNPADYITASGSQSGTHAFCRTVTTTPEPYVSVENGAVYWDALKKAGKYAPDLGAFITEHYNDMVTAGVTFMSCFDLGGSGYVWPPLDPDIYVPNTSQWDAIVAFNN